MESPTGAELTNLTADQVTSTSAMATDAAIAMTTAEMGIVNITESLCTADIPESLESLQGFDVAAYVILALIWVSVVIICVLFIEEFYFIVKYFELRRRKERTVYFLSLFPVYAICALLGIMVPRAATLVELIANGYLATAIYTLVRLFADYTGVVEEIADTLDNPMVSLRSPPCCCCCFCLPEVKFSFKVFRSMVMLVMQTAVIRPVIAFLSAVLWADGSYIPGVIAARNGYIYILVINMASSLLATYGLLLIARILGPPLAEFCIRPKVLCIQIILLGTVLGNLLFSILTMTGVIPCNQYLSSRARATRVYHAYVVFLILLVSILARMAFRRVQDGYNIAKKSTSTLNVSSVQGDGSSVQGDGSQTALKVNDSKDDPKQEEADVNENAPQADMQV